MTGTTETRTRTNRDPGPGDSTGTETSPVKGGLGPGHCDLSRKGGGARHVKAPTRNRARAEDRPTDALAVTLTVGALDHLVREAVASALADHAPARAPRLVDRRGLAEALDVSLPTIDRLRAEGCPCVRIGDVPRFELEPVLEWLRERANQ